MGAGAREEAVRHLEGIAAGPLRLVIRLAAAAPQLLFLVRQSVGSADTSQPPPSARISCTAATSCCPRNPARFSCALRNAACATMTLRYGSSPPRYRTS